MRILYGYSNCTDALYRKITSERNASVLVPDQKYHSLLIRGMDKNGAELYCFSGLPINRSVTARKLIREKDEHEGNVHYHYITTLNFPLLRQLMIFFGTFFGVLKVKKDTETYAICDCLNLANAYGMTFAARLRKIPVVSIVTDLPDMERTGALLKKINNRLFKKADAFILLTEQMNAVVNQKNKPYLVAEGHVDSEAPAPASSASYERDEGKKVLMYAGGLKTMYGIGMLAKGFIKADIPDAELRIYGRGEFEEELAGLCEAHPGIRYMGLVPNSEIVAEEGRVSLLVNPRPTAPAYTKYSFPSKNMEYMVSGTPTLTTKLPGMPAAYIPYIYLIDDESEEGVAQALQSILSLSFEERSKKGRSARDFVLREKSNVVQAKRIVDFLREIVKP